MTEQQDFQDILNERLKMKERLFCKGIWPGVTDEVGIVELSGAIKELKFIIKKYEEMLKTQI